MTLKHYKFIPYFQEGREQEQARKTSKIIPIHYANVTSRYEKNDI
jgi:hypothetical protein